MRFSTFHTILCAASETTYDLTGSTNVKSKCPYLKTVGSGIPGSAPRLKPAKQNHKEVRHMLFIWKCDKENRIQFCFRILTRCKHIV